MELPGGRIVPGLLSLEQLRHRRSQRRRKVDLARGLVAVHERYYRGDTGEPTTESSKRVLALGALVPAYARLKSPIVRDDDYVFQKEGRPMDDRGILRNVIRPVAKSLGIYFEGFGWHSFRRQNLTVIQEVGATPFEAMGHSCPLME
jgi:hypothetical protein